MPVYSYACKNCSHAFEQRQEFSDPALTTCPECGGKLRKVFGSVGVSFKGSGFYRNDSRSNDSAPKKSSTSAEPAKTGTSETSKKESAKSEAKTTPASTPAASTSQAS